MRIWRASTNSRGRSFAAFAAPAHVRTCCRSRADDCARDRARAGACYSVTIPDCISPILGYRVWQWDEAGLHSLNGEPWLPGKALSVACRAQVCGTAVGRTGAVHEAHAAPLATCTCGVYATKSLVHLRRTGVWSCRSRCCRGAWPRLKPGSGGWATTAATSWLPPRSWWCRCGARAQATTLPDSTCSFAAANSGTPDARKSAASSVATAWRCWTAA